MSAQSSAPTEPWAAALRGGAIPTIAVGVVATAAFGLFQGAGAAASAAVGSVLALLALAVGPLLARRARHLSPPGVMAVALAGYGAVVFVLAIAFVVLDQQDWLRGVATGVSLLACSFAWMAGHLRATGRMRVLAFGDPGEPDVSADQVSEGGTSG